MSPEQQDVLTTCRKLFQLLLLCWIPLWLLTALAVSYANTSKIIIDLQLAIEKDSAFVAASLLSILFIVSAPTYLLSLISFAIAPAVKNAWSWLLRSLVLSVWSVPMLLWMDADGARHGGKSLAPTRSIAYLVLIFAVPSVAYVGLAQRKLRGIEANQ